MNIMTQFRNWMAGVWAAKKTEQAKKEIAAVVDDVVDITWKIKLICIRVLSFRTVFLVEFIK